MRANTKISPHAQRVLALLARSKKPLTAYDILDKLKKFGIKAPPTVYRALQDLTARGLVHRVESLNAFIACNDHEEEAHAAQFAVCRGCGTVVEIHDKRLAALIAGLGKSLKFRIEREMLELLGLCKKCDAK